MPEWIRQAFTNILEAIQAIINAVQPGSWYEYALRLIITMLPAPVDISGVLTGMRLVFGYLAPYLLALDYFIDMPAFAACVGLIAVIEFGTGIFRLWRMLRSTLV